MTQTPVNFIAQSQVNNKFDESQLKYTTLSNQISLDGNRNNNQFNRSTSLKNMDLVLKKIATSRQLQNHPLKTDFTISGKPRQ